MSDSHTPEDDVLEPFLTEWADRARRAQEAVNAILAEHSRIPRLHRRRRRDTADQWVLTRSEPSAVTSHAVTVNFTSAEWALIERAVLASHGLMPHPTIEEVTHGG